jgi:transposase
MDAYEEVILKPGRSTMGKRKKYTDEFRREAVRVMMMRGERSVEDVASSLGVAPSLLHAWRKLYPDTAESVRRERGETPEDELKRLRREVAQLKRDKEILKKTAVLFAKEDS